MLHHPPAQRALVGAQAGGAVVGVPKHNLVRAVVRAQPRAHLPVEEAAQPATQPGRKSAVREVCREDVPEGAAGQARRRHPRDPPRGASKVAVGGEVEESTPVAVARRVAGEGVPLEHRSPVRAARRGEETADRLAEHELVHHRQPEQLRQGLGGREAEEEGDVVAVGPDEERAGGQLARRKQAREAAPSGELEPVCHRRLQRAH
mmetsp:Transcript_46438/g.153931  ORF Transcript_46438/g.153931 Transcript_46438/m.153931 type:complete len:205 (-) Transcript_46438:142-756(-)